MAVGGASALNGPVSAGDTLDVTGATTLDSTLDVTGNTSLTTLTVSGLATSNLPRSDWRPYNQWY